MTKLIKILIIGVYALFFLNLVYLPRHSLKNDSDCPFACRPDCNQAKVVGCDPLAPTKPECRIGGDCSQPLSDWSCCVNSAETGGNISPEGEHEAYSGLKEIGECRVVGWTSDPDDTRVDVNYRVLADSQELITSTADEFRDSLIGTCSQGTCAFNKNIYSLIEKNHSYRIKVESRDVQTSTWVPLDETPRQLACSNLICTVTGPTSVCPGTAVTYSVRAAGTGLSSTGLYLHSASSSAGLRTVICTGGDSCSGSFSFPAGSFYVYCNAHTPNSPPNARCNGDPYCDQWSPDTAPDQYGCADWLDCGAGDVLKITADPSFCTTSP